jgi:hypothetical protein
VPTTSIDTFFACTIIIAAALIGTAFLASTMQTRIEATDDINKQSYLKAIADHLVTNTGSPQNWGTSTSAPSDFGLAQNGPAIPYELDMDKLSRLNSQNLNALSYYDLATSAKLSNMAVSVSLLQILSVGIQLDDSHTEGSNTIATFTIITSVDSQPITASLHCYAVANGFVGAVNGSTSGVGVGSVTAQVPSSSADEALLVVFARATCDDRMTSYGIYSFHDEEQQTTPDNTLLTLSPLNYTLTAATNSSTLTINNGYLLTYIYHQTLPLETANPTPIPKLLDKSPCVIIATGEDDGAGFQQWTSYPQAPFTVGSSFSNSEQNVFSYVVTVKGALYRLSISLGDVPP